MKLFIFLLLLVTLQQVVASDNSSQIHLQKLANSSVIVQEQTTYTADAGIFLLDDWEVIATPKTNITIKAKTEAVDLNKTSNANDGLTYHDEINIHIELRDCQLGEVTEGDKCKI